MHLIDVNAVLSIEEGTEELDPNLEVLKCFHGEELQRLEYAILSHCWSTRASDEVTFEQLLNLTRMTRERIRDLPGYWKIVASCRRARDYDQLNWLWVDTCCIEQREREEAINSMYRWYGHSKKCYAYLHDVIENTLPARAEGKKPRWFLRGWTLQELIAPRAVLFFNGDWELIGDKKSLAPTLKHITRIPEYVLAYGLPSPQQTDRPSVAQIFSWAADRETKRNEDRAYSLMGLFEVEIFKSYGTRNAFQRLQEAIIKKYNDHSIFAWFEMKRPGSVLADNPSYFRGSSDIVNCSITGPLPRVQQGIIRTRLSVSRCRSSSFYYEAQLACRRSGDLQRPVTILIASLDDRYYRVFGDFPPTSKTEDRELDLSCRSIDGRSFTFQIPRTVELGDQQLCCNHPDDSLELTRGYKVIHYAGQSQTCGFKVILGHCLGLDSVHILTGRPSSEDIPDPDTLLHHTNRINELRIQIAEGGERTGFALANHVHIPGTAQAVELLYTKRSYFVSLQLHLVVCPGCCTPVWHRQLEEDGDEGDLRVGKCFKKIIRSYDPYPQSDCIRTCMGCCTGQMFEPKVSDVVSLECEKDGVSLTSVISLLECQSRAVHDQIPAQSQDLLKNEIAELQKNLDSAKSNHEKRALVEDIVGRILLLCWHVIDAKIAKELKAKVEHDGRATKISQMCASYIFRKTFMEDIITKVDVTRDGQCPLNRVMMDAKDRILKHQLLVDYCDGNCG